MGIFKKAIEMTDTELWTVYNVFVGEKVGNSHRLKAPMQEHQMSKLVEVTQELRRRKLLLE